MYLELYKSIRSIVADAFGIEMDVDGRIIDTHESALKDIQWFASQYDGVIHTAPVLLVEFQDLDMSVLTKQTGRTHISIRLHVVTEADNESDGDVLYPAIAEHERIATDVWEALKYWKLDFMEGETDRLRPVKWGHNHNYRGYMVTWIELETKGQLTAVI